MIKYIDTHCHLVDEKYESILESVIKQANAEKVAMVTAANDIVSSRKNLEIAKNCQNIWAAVGIYPNDVNKATEQDWLELPALIRSHKNVAVGEIGLDYYWKEVDPKEQKKAFIRQLDLALEYQKPVIVHARNSVEDVLEILEDFSRSGGKTIWHCFVANKKIISKALDFAIKYGVYLGIGGLVTFPDHTHLQDQVAKIPEELLLLETDAPYLPPKPKVDSINMPSNVIRIAEAVSKIREISLDDVARITTRNACKVFNIPLPEDLEKPSSVYKIRNSVYISLTNRCNNNCIFCARRQSYVVKGHNIKTTTEPGFEEILSSIKQFSGYNELVFCGLGEPTLRLEELKKIAAKMREKNIKIRLNTNGLANLEYKRDITGELKNLIDVISVSLNTDDPEQYQKICLPVFGKPSYYAMLEFIRLAVEKGIKTVCTVVDTKNVDIEKARKIALGLGAEFRVRELDKVG